MKANFKKASVFAIAIALVLLMSLSVIPMVSATEEAATNPVEYFDIQDNYPENSDFTETIDAMNISLTGRITLTIYYVIDDAAHDYIELTVPDLDENGKKTTRTYTEKYDPAKLDENGRYPVSVSVAAAQQTDLIKFQWFDADGNAGKWRSYSVRYYADKIMEMASDTDKIPDNVSEETVAKMDQTVKSMLNYGAKVQERFSYETDRLANEGVFEDTNPIDNMLADHLYDAVENVIPDDNKDVFKGVQVFLDNDVRARIYVDATKESDATIDGRPVSIKSDANGTYVGIFNIPANKFAQEFEITVNGETITYSILGWCLDTIKSFRSSEGDKDVAKALYQYYTWTTSYADNTYVPGPKTEDENGNVVSACTHERYYVKGENVLCSDCGENISTTTRVSLVADETSFEISEAGTKVTFTLKVVGSTSLQGLIVTPVAEGLTLSDPTVEQVDATGSINGTAGLNIVIDASKPIDQGCDLVKVTYTVVANNGAGTYKIGLTVQEATGVDTALIVPVTTVLEAVSPTCTHTPDGYDVTAAGHRWYCEDCKQVGKWESHTLKNVWEPVIEANGNIDGKLYESMFCNVCEKAAQTREVYYVNNIDSVKVNDTVINPFEGNKAQTAGLLTHDNPGYATFVINSENFIDVNGNALVFKDTDSLKTGGWFGANGGVARYVIKINDGEWKTLSGTPGNTKAGDGGIGDALKKNANLTDDGRYTNSNYQGGLAYHDFEKYAGQTVTITLGAVPANNPGLDDDPNVLITAVVENLKIECTHLAQNVVSIEATDDPTVFNATCACGESYTTSDINDEALKMFNADEIVYRAEGQGGSNYSITKMTENGLDFARFELTCEKTGEQEFLYYFANGNEGNATNLTYGLSDTFMIVYRANKAYPSALTLYINQSGWQSQAYSLKDDSQWHIAMYDLSALYDDTYGRLNTIRLDIFDAGSIEKGATIDIAYMGFFKSEDHAIENYAKAAEKHEAIGKAANWALNLDGFLVDGTNYKGKNPPVSGSTGQFGCMQVDLEGYTIATSKSSIIFRGWLVTPFGAEGIYYTITDADGNVSERKLYVKPGNAYSGILNASTSYRFGSQRGNGSIFQDTNAAFDLSEYERQTVSIDVILVNNLGQEGTIMQIKNVAVPCTHKAADDAVWTLDENDPMFEKADCLYCDGKAERYVSDTTNGLLLWTPNELYSKTSGWSNGSVKIKEENGLPYISYTASKDLTAEQTTHIYQNTGAPLKVGAYAAILYRTSYEGPIQVLANSTAGAVTGPAVDFGSNADNLNQWTFRVNSFPASGTAYDAKQQTASRLDWFNIPKEGDKTINTNDHVDIAFIAYFDSEAEAYAFFSKYVKAYGEESWCDHKSKTSTWVSAEKIYKTTCNGCGKLMSTDDMIYKSEANASTYAGSKDNFLTASTVTENGETFVRYTATKATSNGDTYFYPWTDNTTNVTGQFMVIKYRLTNNGTNMTASTPYASSAASGQTAAAGANGDASNVWLIGNTLYADGNWHYLIVAPDVAKNTTFTKNADGTYTWAYFRMKLIGLAAYDSSCYFDIAEVAFADNEEAAFNYAGVDKTYYVAHFDTLKVDKTSVASIPANTTNTYMLEDMVAETLTAANSVSAGGWFVTPGGVQSYKIRVIKVNGTAVTNPTLVGGVTSGNCGETDGVTKVGTAKGWAVTCGIGARYTAASIDLSAYAGKTVEFEIVAITNFGAEAIVARFTNVAVPAAE